MVIFTLPSAVFWTSPLPPLLEPQPASAMPAASTAAVAATRFFLIFIGFLLGTPVSQKSWSLHAGDPVARRLVTVFG